MESVAQNQSFETEYFSAYVSIEINSADKNLIHLSFSKKKKKKNGCIALYVAVHKKINVLKT